jgi:putative redox protein
MECTVDWLGIEGMSFSAEVGSGHLVNMDGAPEAGGRNLAPRPMELLLAGAGGCTAFDVVMILKKARQKISACRVKIEAVRAETDPKVFTHINMKFIVTGQQLDASRVSQAVNLSHEKYCSATIMLGKTARITHSIEIIEG